MTDWYAEPGPLTLPWDGWGPMSDEVKNPEAVDPVAKLTAAVGTPTVELRALYDANPDLRVPDVLTSFVEGQPVEQPWDDSRLH